MKRPTIHDVARRASVSVSTVSRVLNQKGDVAVATRQRVEQAVQELGFVASKMARSLRGLSTNRLGIMVTNLDSYNQSLVRSMTQEAHVRGYNCIVFTRGHYSGQMTLAQQEQQDVTDLNGVMVDGMILVTPRSDFTPSAAPLVVVEPTQSSRYPLAVYADSREGARRATQALLVAGHTRVGYVRGRSEARSTEERQVGIRTELESQGLTLNPAWVAQGDFTRESGQQAARHLLTGAERPTALICGNDQMALGVYDTAQVLGVRIPEDLSVVGFDDIPEAVQAEPPLSTVSLDTRIMGTQAIHLLVTSLQMQAILPQELSMPMMLILRQSIAAPGS